MRRQRRKRKFSLFSAIFLEVASILGIVAIAQPNLIVDWFAVRPGVTMQSSVPKAPLSSFDSARDPNQPASRIPNQTSPGRKAIEEKKAEVTTDQPPNRSSARSTYKAYQHYVPPGVYPTPHLHSPSRMGQRANGRVPAELAAHQRYSPSFNDRTPKAERLTFPSLADLRGNGSGSRFERNYQRLPIFP